MLKSFICKPFILQAIVLAETGKSSLCCKNRGTDLYQSHGKDYAEST
jgi:hypothetical protein